MASRPDPTTLLLAMWLGFSQASADCIDYRDYLHWLGGVDLADQAHDVAVFGPYAYIAAYESGLQVVDVSDPQGPRIAGGANTPGNAFGVFATDEYICVADGSRGLQILPAQCPPSSGTADGAAASTRSVLLVSPNPTSGGAIIRLVTANGPVRPTVHDVSGRRVRLLTKRALCSAW